MYSLIAKSFLRSRAVSIAVVLILVIGIISILTGKQFLLKQEKAVEAADAFLREHIERYSHYHHDDIGLVMYYLRFPFINKPEKIAALSIGQRDVNPSIQAVTIRTLEAQRYDNDLNNPSNLLSGNLDLGFVFIYLFPLLTIAFTFNLLSDEIEGGTWRLVKIQSRSGMVFLLHKLWVRIILIYVVLLLLLLMAAMLLSIPLNETWWAFVVISVLYIAFWIALCSFIVSLQKSSNFNAVTLLSLWVVLVILLPASVNNFIVTRYPVPEALTTMIGQRDGYHEKWDMEKERTMNKFYAHYPQFSKYTVPAGNFSWLWYYAMQQMGDDDSREHSEEMRKQIELREAAGSRIARVIPTMHTQLLFNDLTQSGLKNHLQFLDSTEVFHEKLRMYFYPRIFENTPVEEVAWETFQPTFFKPDDDIRWWEMVFPLLAAVPIMMLLSGINMKRPGN